MTKKKMPSLPVEKTGTQSARGMTLRKKEKERRPAGSQRYEEGRGKNARKGRLYKNVRQKRTEERAGKKRRRKEREKRAGEKNGEKNGSEDPPLQKKEKEGGRTALRLLGVKSPGSTQQFE